MIAAMELVTRSLELSPMTEQEARACVIAIKGHLTDARGLALELYERQGWAALGYSSWRECAIAEFEQSQGQVYRLLDAAMVDRVISPMGEKPLPERQTRELAPLLRQDEAAVVEVWRELRQEHGDRITAEKVREAVSARLEKPPEPIVSPAHVSYNSGNNEWYTPADYIEAARRVMGAIDLDPASSRLANKTVGASTYHTAEDNGLFYSWAGRVWMNPPYAAELIGRFTEKIARHYQDGDISEAIVLVNNATDTNWFQGLMTYASAVCFVKQRIRFIDMAGNPTGAPLQGQAVLYLGSKPVLFGKEFSVFGTVLYGERTAWCNQE